MDSTGRLNLLDLWGCDSAVLDDPEILYDALCDAAQAAKVDLIDSVFHCFDPSGVTGVILVSECHLSIHTWPEQGYAAVDVYTSGKGLPGPAIGVIKDALDAKRICVAAIERGLKRSPSIALAHIFEEYG